MINLNDIAYNIQEAAGQKNKSAMSHYQALINAKELKSVDPIEFCKEVNMPVTYATEFRKMIKLADLIDSQ